jgi:hypothetical protein
VLLPVLVCVKRQHERALARQGSDSKKEAEAVERERSKREDELEDRQYEEHKLATSLWRVGVNEYRQSHMQRIPKKLQLEEQDQPLTAPRREAWRRRRSSFLANANPSDFKRVPRRLAICTIWQQPRS